jgi:hypothetical protein
MRFIQSQGSCDFWLRRLVPVPGGLGPESVHRTVVAGHGIVGLVPAHHGGQPSPLLRDGLVTAPAELVLDLLQLGPQPFRVGLAPDPEPPAPGRHADMREAQERMPASSC